MRYAIAYARCYLAMRKLGLEMVRVTKELDATLAHAKQVYIRTDAELDQIREEGTPYHNVNEYSGYDWELRARLRHIPIPSAGRIVNRYGLWKSIGEAFRHAGPELLRGDAHTLETVYPDTVEPRLKRRGRYGISKYVGPSPAEKALIAPWLKRARMVEDILELHNAKLEQDKSSLV
jgi:hypothetical protein